MSSGDAVTSISPSSVSTFDGSPGNPTPSSLRTVLRPPSQPTTNRARSGVAVSVPRWTVTPSSSCSSPTTAQPRRISAPTSAACSASSWSVSVCGMPSTYPWAVSSPVGAGFSMPAKNPWTPPGRIGYCVPLLEEPLQQPPLIHHLDTAHVQPERTHERRQLGVLLQHEHVDALQSQFARQHHAGRSAAGDDHIEHAFPHGVPISRPADDCAPRPGLCCCPVSRIGPAAPVHRSPSRSRSARVYVASAARPWLVKATVVFWADPFLVFSLLR